MIQIQSIAFTSYNLGLHCDYSFLRICNAEVMSQGICNPHSSTTADECYGRITNAYTLYGRIKNPTEHKRQIDRT